jgi:hypothetical protein
VELERRHRLAKTAGAEYAGQVIAAPDVTAGLLPMRAY